MPIIYGYTLLVCILSCSNAFSQRNWSLKREKDGIKVYSRTAKYSKFNELKVELEIKTTLPEFYSVIANVDKYPLWVYGTKSAAIIKRLSAEEVIYYSEFNAPWPFSNRDLYSRLKIIRDTVNNVITINSNGVPDFKPNKKGVIRVPHSASEWTVKAIDNSTLSIVYIVNIDPGGKLPAWLVNLFATSGPVESFNKLRELCK
jgi:hypothetical protein